jgi:hypothetical protein
VRRVAIIGEAASKRAVPLLYVLLLLSSLTASCARQDPPAQVTPRPTTVNTPSFGVVYISPDAKWVATHAADGTGVQAVRVSDLATESLPSHLRQTRPSVLTPWSIDSRLLLTTNRGNEHTAELVVWNRDTRKYTTLTLPGILDGAAAAFSPSGRYVACGYQPSTTTDEPDVVLVWDTHASGTAQHRIVSVSGSVSQLCWLSEERLLALSYGPSGGLPGPKRKANLVNVRTGGVEASWPMADQLSVSLAPYLSSQGRLVVYRQSQKVTEIVQLDPTTGAVKTAAETGKRHMTSTLVWASPIVHYVWSRPTPSVTIQEFDSRSGKVRPEISDGRPIQPTADSTGRLWGVKNKKLISWRPGPVDKS